jgi:hypothetical protein
MAAPLAKAIDEMPTRSEMPGRDTRENMYNPICTKGIRLPIVFDNDNDYQKQSKKLQMWEKHGSDCESVSRNGASEWV